MVHNGIRRFLSDADCTALLARIARGASAGGITWLTVESRWTGGTRWGRNQLVVSSDVRENACHVGRLFHGIGGQVAFNRLDDAGITDAVHDAERLAGLSTRADAEWERPYPPIVQSYAHPTIFSDATYNLDADARADAARALIAPAEAAGLLSAGYIEVSGHGWAVMNTAGVSMYYPYTRAQYSVTVRDPQGTASGWAGQDFYDWGKIDTAALSRRAVEKCLASRNPVAIEPGRYTVILEPQAVGQLVSILFDGTWSTYSLTSQVWNAGGHSRLGQRVVDERLTFTSDPMDPELGYVPFDLSGTPYRPVTWIDRGVLSALAYSRDVAVMGYGKDDAVDTPDAIRMSGGTASIDDMIASTQRGLRVTRFSELTLLDVPTLLTSGVTRDGVWLIENGKISKPIKNLRFTESPLFVFNQIEQLGRPERVFHPDAPIVAPPIKARDFSFTALADAV